MKTTNELNNYEVTANSEYDLETKWYSEEEIKEAILEVKKWEHHDLSQDWEVELLNKLFGDEK